MTLSELLEQLQAIQEELEDRDMEDPEVRLAFQPNWPFEYSIRDVVSLQPGEDDIKELEDEMARGTDKEELAEFRKELDRLIEERENAPTIVYLGEGRHIGYLPGEVSKLLGWR